MSAPWGHAGEVKLRARSGTRRGLASAATPGGSRGPGGGVRRQRGGVASRYWPRGDHSKISLKKAAVGVHTLAQCRWQRDRAIVTSELAVKDIDGGGAGGEKQRPRRRDLQGAKWCCISSPNILVDIQHLTSPPLRWKLKVSLVLATRRADSDKPTLSVKSLSRNGFCSTSDNPFFPRVNFGLAFFAQIIDLMRSAV